MKIIKTGLLFDESNSTWFELYQAPGVTDDVVTIEVPRDVREPNVLFKLLLREGAKLPAYEDCRAELKAVIESDAKIVRRAKQTGWRQDGSFVTHTFVAGRDDNTLLPPSPPVSGVAAALAVSGTLKEWKALISVARFSTAMIVALCAAFAAPLLSLLERVGFGLVFVGRTRGGKTTAQMLAASVIGWGRERELPTLRGTDAGILEAGLIFNDHLLPFNEVGTARGDKRKKFEALGETTYALTTGRDTLRHSSWSQGQGGPSSFQVLPILSSERSPDEWAALGGETREAGETVRLISYQAVDNETKTVFDRPPASARADVMTWAIDQFGRLRRQLPHQRGTAWRAYLAKVVGNKEEVARVAEERMARFQLSFRRSSADPLKRDVVSKFSLLCAGGLAAIDAKVLPFKEVTIINANKRACKQSLQSLPDPVADLRRNVAVLKTKLEGGGMIDAATASASVKQSMGQADGFFMRESYGRAYTIRAETFHKYFRSKPAATQVLDWLDQQGILQHARERRTARSNEWAQTVCQWPGGGRARCICLFIGDRIDILDLVA